MYWITELNFIRKNIFIPDFSLTDIKPFIFLNDQWYKYHKSIKKSNFYVEYTEFKF